MTRGQQLQLTPCWTITNELAGFLGVIKVAICSQGFTARGTKLPISHTSRWRKEAFGSSNSELRKEEQPVISLNEEKDQEWPLWGGSCWSWRESLKGERSNICVKNGDTPTVASQSFFHLLTAQTDIHQTMDSHLIRFCSLPCRLIWGDRLNSVFNIDSLTELPRGG